MLAAAGAVSALSLSADHTFLAVGHISGHIFLYDLSRPQSPVRSVPPVDYESVLAARKEGHLHGSRINQLSFVGSRHTAIVSADENGLAFYHSLGKVLFVAANDVLRILGNYPEENPSPRPNPKTLQNNKSTPGSGPSTSFVFPKPPRHRKSAPILAMQSLPVAVSSPTHPVDSFQVIALLTPIKIVIVGLKPAPRTWYRRHRGDEFDDDNKDKSEEGTSWRGAMAWYPSMAKVPEENDSESQNGAPNEITEKSKSRKATLTPEVAVATKPILAYSWGRSIMILRVRAEKVPVRKSAPTLIAKQEKPQDAPTHTLGLVFEESIETMAESDVMAIHWLNENVRSHRFPFMLSFSELRS